MGVWRYIENAKNMTIVKLQQIVGSHSSCDDQHLALSMEDINLLILALSIVFILTFKLVHCIANILILMFCLSLHLVLL